MTDMSDTNASAGDTTDAYALALDVLASTPTVLSALLESLPADVWAWSPAPGEWSPQEIVAHMLHIETAVIPVRVRAMVETDGAALSGASPAETTGTPAEMLAAWRTARAENLAYLRALTPEQLTHGGEHPTYGRISAREHIVEWAYHDLEHTRQLQATLEARLYPAIGGFRALYSAPYPIA
ncbi:MAG TPA: DinB family protein [Ktedonobacterales bacterium]|nr:DinB family protein [Ktedonobacterales bacterium]